MKPIDFRNANFEALRGGLDDARRRVYEAWIAHGPCTTRGLAAACGIDLLTVRPRTTELFQLGLVALAENADGLPVWDPGSREGLYRAVPKEEWERWRESQVSGQQVLI